MGDEYIEQFSEKEEKSMYFYSFVFVFFQNKELKNI